MKLSLSLTLALVSLAVLVGVVGYRSNATLQATLDDLEAMRRSSLEEAGGAAAMLSDLQDAQRAAQELIAERYRSRVEAAHDSEWGIASDIEVDLIEESLDRFEERLEAGLQLVHFDPGQEDLLMVIGREFAVNRSLVKRLVHLARYHPSDHVSEFVDDELRPHYRTRMLPPIREYESQARGAVDRNVVQIESSLDAAKRRNRNVALAALAAAVLFAVWMARSITRPLDRLREAASRVGRGDLLEPVPVTSHNEIGQVTETFNQMMANLRESTVSRTRLEGSLAEKEILLKEVHHRVKNNLQVISSLLSLQGSEDDETAHRIRDCQNRILSMAILHEQLYRSEDLARIDFADYAAELVERVVRSHGPRGPGIKTHVAVSPASLPLDEAIPCGMILTELVSNAIEHAFPDGSGEIWVGFEAQNGVRRLTVRDDGVGVPSGLDPASTDSLGLKLVAALAEQLDGELTWSVGEGTEFSLAYAET